MRLCTFRPGDGPPEGWPGRVDGEHIVQLDAPDLITVLARRGQVPAAATGGRPTSSCSRRCPGRRRSVTSSRSSSTSRPRGPTAGPRCRPSGTSSRSSTSPTRPRSPVREREIRYPAGTAELDYELEVAAVIGADGEIGGFTVMNDWSARDIQRKEMRVGLGPAKAKDFATSFGPVLVTADEFDGSRAVMTARVNGEERSRGQLADLYYPWPALLAHAARNTVLRPGDIIGSGTVGTGCILEHNDGRWLQPGDVVEMEVEGIGILRNTVGPGSADGRPEMADGDGSYDVIVIGAGLVGLATAMALLADRPGLRLAVLEKEAAVGTHQSGHNSGVMHAGLYYQPGSLKARFCTAGRLAMMEFAQAHQIPYRQTGKLVVATRDSELPRLASLAERGRANGLAVREIGPAEMTEIEPAVRGIRALHIPESGVIDYRLVAAAYADTVRKAGGQVLCGHGVRGLARTAAGWLADTDAGPLRARAVIACAGLQADRIAALTGQGGGGYRIVPFRGDYYTFRPRRPAWSAGWSTRCPTRPSRSSACTSPAASTARCTPGRTRCPRWPGRGTGGWR